MNLKEVYNTFPDPPHLISVNGKQILTERIKPLISVSKEYLKITSFFNPKVIISIFSELAMCFKSQGNVKIIIGIHDASKLIPILDIIDANSLEEKYRIAVSKIIEEDISACQDLMSDNKNFVFVMSELVKQNLIEIKIACIKSDYKYYIKHKHWPRQDTIFHPKISIFNDGVNSVVMTGSINSTLNGYGKNKEEANFRDS